MSTCNAQSTRRWALLVALCCLGIAIGTQPAIAQWGQSNGPDGGPVTGLSTNASNGYVFAVANGLGFRSTDAGASWTQLLEDLPTTLNVFVIESVGANTYLSGVTTGVEFYHSTDFGDSWTKKTMTGFPIAVIRSLLLAGPNLLAGVSSGGVYKTTDQGDTWTASNTGMPAGLDVAPLALKGTDVYAATSLVASVDSIYRSTDNGASWAATATTFFDASPITGVTGLSANSVGVFASISSKGVQRSTDNGATWVKVNPVAIPGTNFAFTVLATSTNLFIGVGGYIFRADQNGNNWDSLYVGLPPRGAGQAIRYLTKSGTTFLAGTGGTGPGNGVHRSTDNGDTWVKSNTGLRALKINGLLASAPYLYAAGDAQGFFRSSDNGLNWTEINTGIPYNAGWYCLAKTGSDLLGGTAAFTLYRSSDNGDTWSLSNTGFTLTNTFDFFVEGSTVYATGYSGINKSTDGGLNWTALPVNFSLGITGLALWKDGVNMMVGANAGMKRSTNSGDTWDAPMAGLAGFGGYGAFTQIGSTIFVASTTGVYRTTDGGANWTLASTGITGTSASAVASDGNDLYAGTASNGVFHSTDDGTTWAPLNNGMPAPIGVNKFAVTTNPHLFAGGTRASVWSLPLSPTSVHEVNVPLPRNFSLAQNYPNPFNAQTKIEFSLAKSTQVRLDILNVLGQKVASLINEELPAGTFQVLWDGTNSAGTAVASGTYLYRFVAGDFSETKRMNLLK